MNVALSGWIVKEIGILNEREEALNLDLGVMLSEYYLESGSPDVTNGYLRSFKLLIKLIYKGVKSALSFYRSIRLT